MNFIMFISKANMVTNRDYYSDTRSLVYKIETENVYDNFSQNKMFDFSNYSGKSKYYNDSKALVIGKMKDEMSDVAIEEFAGLKPKLYSILVNNYSKYKTVKAVNKIVVAEISHNMKMCC